MNSKPLIYVHTLQIPRIRSLVSLIPPSVQRQLLLTQKKKGMCEEDEQQQNNRVLGKQNFP